MDDQQGGPGPEATPELLAIRHDRLRRSAPAVQHEINNALMVLTSNLELLARSVAEGAPRRQLDRAQQAARRLDEMMRAYLDAARREASEVAVIPPAAALRQLAPLLRVLLGARNGFDIAPEPSMAEAALDRARLDLALLSLARDAAGRMAQGARIVAWVEVPAGTAEVVLGLTLPSGAEPHAETARLLVAAATATGGRLERTADGIGLVWPRVTAGG